MGVDIATVYDALIELCAGKRGVYFGTNVIAGYLQTKDKRCNTAPSTIAPTLEELVKMGKVVRVYHGRSEGPHVPLYRAAEGKTKVKLVMVTIGDKEHTFDTSGELLGSN
ncbi:MAG: hypothetical protein QF535_23330 [Anaerolineales bacterium]|jgi:hypothetical protein|nr:hypothetical protein [Anaerolineales bacterium]|tara:strand:- start:233 stop:562 length:330 start_codon:yes stop_codon:yes gene_type:complete